MKCVSTFSTSPLSGRMIVHTCLPIPLLIAACRCAGLSKIGREHKNRYARYVDYYSSLEGANSCSLRSHDVRSIESLADSLTLLVVVRRCGRAMQKHTSQGRVGDRVGRPVLYLRIWYYLRWCEAVLASRILLTLLRCLLKSIRIVQYVFDWILIYYYIIIIILYNILLLYYYYY